MKCKPEQLLVKHKLVGVGVPARQAYGNGTRAVRAMPTAERRNNGGQGGGG